MGFGKWLLGGVCAVGAVVAAPVVLPAAGLAVAGSAIGATSVGLSAGLGMMAASTGTVAATAAAAGAAGVAVGAAQEKKQEKAYDKGKWEGMVDTSKEYEEKFREQNDFFERTTAAFEFTINCYEMQLDLLNAREELTQEESEKKDQLICEMLECIKKYENDCKKFSGEDNATAALVSSNIANARNLLASFR